MYKTQAAWVHAPAAINGDKVFWHRPTDSLCYKASVSVSSGDANMLNNFKLLDSTDITDFGRMPYEGTWATEPGDSDRSAIFNFPEAVPLSVIRLYDNPDAFHNVLNAEIVFDDGSRIETGPLEYQGAPTDFEFEPKKGCLPRFADGKCSPSHYCHDSCNSCLHRHCNYLFQVGIGKDNDPMNVNAMLSVTHQTSR